MMYSKKKNKVQNGEEKQFWPTKPPSHPFPGLDGARLLTQVEVCGPPVGVQHGAQLGVLAALLQPLAVGDDSSPVVPLPEVRVPFVPVHPGQLCGGRRWHTGLPSAPRAPRALSPGRGQGAGRETPPLLPAPAAHLRGPAPRRRGGTADRPARAAAPRRSRPGTAS